MTYLDSTKYIPSEGDPNSKIWLVGEAPGYEEVNEGRPFIGRAGELLNTVLARHNILRSDCFITNLCHYRPKGNVFALVEGTDELKAGLAELYGLAKMYSPNVIVALGAAPLKYLCGKENITNWRGSILEGTNVNSNKVIPTYHPAYILRDQSAFTVFDFDFSRIKQHSTFGDLPKLPFDFVYGTSVREDIVDAYTKAPYLSVDIESVKGSSTIICVGFARSRYEAISITLTNATEVEWISRLLTSPAKKIFHFGSFDTSMLRLNGFTIEGYTDDTIIQAHILNPELPRDLGFLTSIYTDIPYYKTEGRSQIPTDIKGWSLKRNKQDLMIYNCKDVCATYWCFEEQLKDINEDPNLKSLYEYEMKMVLVAGEMGDHGLLIDLERKELLKNILIARKENYQAMLNVICGTKININSPKQMASALYSGLELPERTKKGGNVTADNDALVSLLSHVKTKLDEYKTDKKKNEYKLKEAFISLAIKLRSVEKLLSSYINISVSNDHHVRSLFKVNGTESGRWAANKFVDGTGCNLQTIPRESIED